MVLGHDFISSTGLIPNLTSLCFNFLPSKLVSNSKIKLNTSINTENYFKASTAAVKINKKSNTINTVILNKVNFKLTPKLNDKLNEIEKKKLTSMKK